MNFTTAVETFEFRATTIAPKIIAELDVISELSERMKTLDVDIFDGLEDEPELYAEAINNLTVDKIIQLLIAQLLDSDDFLEFGALATPLTAEQMTELYDFARVIDPTSSEIAADLRDTLRDVHEADF